MFSDAFVARGQDQQMDRMSLMCILCEQRSDYGFIVWVGKDGEQTGMCHGSIICCLNRKNRDGSFSEEFAVPHRTKFSIRCKGVNTGLSRAEILNMMSLSSPNGRPAILVTDNDVFARNLLNRDLSREGYFVLGAANCAEAIALSHNFAGKIHLFLCNFDLPGREHLTDGIVRDRPGIRVIVISVATHTELIEGRSVRGRWSGQETALPEVLHNEIRRALSDTESGDAREV
jgi:CheY-like chemotaxis protein